MIVTRSLAPRLTLVALFALAWFISAADAKTVAQVSPAVSPASAASFAPLAFTGLTLSQAEEKAVDLSPEVITARAKLDAASAVLDRARAAFGPSIVAGYMRNPQAGTSPQPSVIVQHSFNVGLSTTLGNIAAFVPGLNQAQANYRAARAEELSAERTERVKAATFYFTALKARATLLARREALDLANAQQQAAQKRYNAGDAPHVDVVRAEVAVAHALADSENAQAADANAAQALALETGVAENALNDTTLGTMPQVPNAALSVGTATVQAFKTRQELASAQNDVSAAQSGLSTAKLGLLPLVTVSAGYAHGVDVGQPVQGPVVNASFELPLNANAASGIRESNALLVQAQARLSATQRQITTEVGSAVRNLNAAILATAASTKAREAAQEELRATEIGYRTGASSSLERITANATYADARLAEVSAIYDEALARAVVALELGL